MFESLFIEVDKSVFKPKRNVIIGEIYRPPSSDKKKFNTELENLLHKIERQKICIFDGRLQHIYLEWNARKHNY